MTTSTASPPQSDLVQEIESEASGRIRELDGLRGVAIALVCVGHLLEGLGPGYRPLLTPLHGGGAGTMGVTLFFVLSGFLITSVLLKDLERGHIRLKAFYVRRFRRLMPALVVVCFIYGLYEWTWGSEWRWGAIGAVWRALTYTSNLDLRLVADSGWLSHTWSLAVEEQFYLVWPLLLISLSKWGRKVATLGAVTIAIATIIARYTVPMSEDTMFSLFRWDPLLLGCAIALWGIDRLRFKWAGTIAAVFVAVAVIYRPLPVTPNDYLAVTLIAVCALLGASRGTWLRNPLLVHLGLISYGLYLWHVVIYRFGLHPVLSVGLSLLAAEISYRLVERPFLTRRIIHLEPAI